MTKKEDGFLPDGYTPPTASGAYMKLQDGDNVFRVLSSAVLGYEYWNEDNKPIRSKEPFKETPGIKKDKDGKAQKVRHFWAFVVWNYATKNIELLELTQSSLQKAITALAHDADWGSPKEYDIKINKTGANLETKYSVSPKPKKELSPEIVEQFNAMKIDMEAIYSNNSPFDGDF